MSRALTLLAAFAVAASAFGQITLRSEGVVPASGGQGGVFSPSGRYFAVQNGRLWVWDTTDWSFQASAPTYGEWLPSFGWMPDDRIVVSPLPFGGVVFTDVESREVVRELRDGIPIVLKLRVSRDGRTVVCVHRRSIAAYDTESGARLWSLPSENRYYASVSEPDSHGRMAVGRFEPSRGARVSVVDPRSGESLSAFSAINGIVALSSDGQYVAAISPSVAAVYSATSGQRLAMRQWSTENFESLTFARDPRLLYLGARALRAWDWQANTLAFELVGASKSYQPVVSPDGRLVYTSIDNEAFQIDPTTGETIADYSYVKGRADDAVLSSDGREALIVSSADRTQWFSLADGRRLRSFHVRGERLSKSGRYMLSYAGQSVYETWDLQSGQRLGRFVSNNRPAAIYEDLDQVLAHVSPDVLIRWNRAGQFTGSFEAFPFNSVAQTHREGVLMLGTPDRAHFLDTDTLAVVRSVPQSETPVSAVFSTDGRLFATRHYTRPGIFDAQTGALLGVPVLPSQSFRHGYSSVLTFLPDNDVVIESWPGVLARLSPSGTLKEMWRLPNGAAYCLKAWIANDGRSLAILGYSGSVEVFALPD